MSARVTSSPKQHLPAVVEMMASTAARPLAIHERAHSTLASSLTLASPSVITATRWSMRRFWMGCVSLQMMQQTCIRLRVILRLMHKCRCSRNLSDSGAESEVIGRQQAPATSRRARFFKILHYGE
jgi:hypothetical protein